MNSNVRLDDKIEVNDQLLDALVSGELQGAKYRQVLLAIESEPHLWRACALAFLREQAIQQDLLALAAGHDWQSDLAVGKDHMASKTSAIAVARKDGWQFGNRNTVAQRFAALAALLLVSFSVGWMGAGMQLGTPAIGSVDAQHSSMIPALPGVDVAGTTPAAALRNQIEPVPMVGMEIPPELIELERSGKVRIETFEAWMPMTFDDGSSGIVPVYEYRVEPVARSY